MIKPENPQQFLSRNTKKITVDVKSFILSILIRKLFENIKNKVKKS